MSEEKLPKHRDENTDLHEDQELAGTVRLAQAALLSPQPPAQAEADSRARILAQLSPDDLTPRQLQEAELASSALTARIQRGIRRLFRR